MLGGRDSKRLSVLLGPVEEGNVLGFTGCSGQKRASIPLLSPQDTVQAGSGRTGTCLGLSRCAQTVLSG